MHMGIDLLIIGAAILVACIASILWSASPPRRRRWSAVKHTVPPHLRAGRRTRSIRSRSAARAANRIGGSIASGGDAGWDGSYFAFSSSDTVGSTHCDTGSSDCSCGCADTSSCTCDTGGY